MIAFSKVYGSDRHFAAQAKVPSSSKAKNPDVNSNFVLVGGWATPLKNMSSSIGMMT